METISGMPREERIKAGWVVDIHDPQNDYLSMSVNFNDEEMTKLDDSMATLDLEDAKSVIEAEGGMEIDTY